MSNGSKVLNLTERINTKDTHTLKMPVPKSQGRGYRTRVQITNELGETLFTENSLMLSGSVYTLEKLFNVESSLQFADLNTIMGIANTGAPITEKYLKEHAVCLFGVGTGGAGDSITSVYDVDVKQRELQDMIPFRVTSDELSSSDREKYWFRETVEDGATAYYLKSFETKPVIRSLWKDGEGDEDGTAVESNVHESPRSDGVETFIELVLKINKNDCREYFERAGNTESTRINTIGLFAGVKAPLEDGVTMDYKQVRLFSSLNFNNEMLTSAKELTINYRIYTL